jgi:hypothetical protein
MVCRSRGSISSGFGENLADSNLMPYRPVAAVMGGELQGRQVFPEVLLGQYWDDRVQGLSGPRYLGLRKMAFW